MGPDRMEKMDAYIPSAKFPRPLPVVIWIHGGGWSTGSKNDKRERNICNTLAENGYAAFSIDYLITKNMGKAPSVASATPAEPDKAPGDAEENADSNDAYVPWPQNLYDCKSALRFIRKETTRFGIDPDRIAVSGGSAGGHLALMVGLTADVPELNKGGLYTDQSNKVTCILDFYGPTAINDKKREKKFAGKTGEETKANLKTASPLTYVAKDSPPTFIVHGTKDGTVSISQSRNLARKMDEAGTVHLFIEVPGGPHSFDLQSSGVDLRPRALEFLSVHLLGTPTPAKP